MTSAFNTFLQEDLWDLHLTSLSINAVPISFLKRQVEFGNGNWAGARGPMLQPDMPNANRQNIIHFIHIFGKIIFLSIIRCHPCSLRSLLQLGA